MSMISVLIPVYKESNLLETLLNQLLKDDYKDKEIITVIDEPTKTSINLAKKYKKKVKFILNKVRKGKVTALNEATKIAKGDIFLFFDSDVIISKKSRNFLKTVAEKIENVDILDIKKKPFGSSLLSKIINYEFVVYNTYSFYCSKIVKKCIGVCGQAFAIQRIFFERIGGFQRVIAEDIELGIQTFLKNGTFKFTDDIEVLTIQTSSWKSWFKQRERWGVGGGYQFKKHWKTILKHTFLCPRISLLTIFLGWPTLLSLLSLFLVDTFMGKLFFLSLISLSLNFTFLTPFVFILSLYTIFIRNLLLFFVTYIFSALLFYLVSKKFDHTFNKLDFTIYYILYSPVSSCFYFFHFLRGIFSSEEVILEDWKV